jgi:hypothetical protein
VMYGSSAWDIDDLLEIVATVRTAGGSVVVAALVNSGAPRAEIDRDDRWRRGLGNVHAATPYRHVQSSSRSQVMAWMTGDTGASKPVTPEITHHHHASS